VAAGLADRKGHFDVFWLRKLGKWMSKLQDCHKATSCPYHTSFTRCVQ